MKTTEKRLLGRVSIAALACIAGTAAAGPIVYTTVAFKNTDGALGPGMGAGVTFSDIGQQQPSINDSGRVAFRGLTSGTGTPQGMWIYNAGANSNVMLGGGPRPGGGTYPTGTSLVNSTQINNANDWAFRLSASTGLFGSVGGVAGRIALAGDVAPGVGGATYATSAVASGTPYFNALGQAGYIGSLTTGTGTPAVSISGPTANAAGIWVGPAGATNLVLRQNDSIDGTGTVRVATFQNLSMGLNDSGRYVVNSSLQGTVVTGNGAGSNSAMIATNRFGSLEVLARVGNAAPTSTGAPSATDLYRNFGTGAIGFNNTGRVAFSSSLRNAAGTQTATGALFSDTSGTMKLVAKIGDAMPTILSADGNPLSEYNGVTWGLSYGSPIINATNTAAFYATGLGNTGATNNTGTLLTMTSSGVFTKVERDHDVAIVGGSPLGSDAFFLSVSSVTMNSSGQMAFTANLTGASVSVGLGNGSALFGWNATTGLMLIARTGDTFHVGPGDDRTIASIGGIVTSGGQDGKAHSLNESGILAFELDFTDGGSGIFTAAIPAPGAVPALMAFGLLAGRRRR